MTALLLSSSTEPTLQNFQRLLVDYVKLKGENDRNNWILESALKQNAMLEGKLKAAGIMMIGGDGVNPGYPDMETCVKDQMNNGKDQQEAEQFCQALANKTNNNNNNSNNTTKQASINNNNNKKEVPAWIQNNPAMSIYAGTGIPNNNKEPTRSISDLLRDKRLEVR